MMKIPEQYVKNTVMRILDDNNVRYSTEVGIGDGLRIDLLLLDVFIGIEVKGIPIEHKGNKSVNTQLEEYKSVLPELWLVVANEHSRRYAIYNSPDKIINVHDFENHMTYLKKRIDNY